MLNPELNRYNVSEPQSNENALPNRLASAAIIAPTHKLIFLSGSQDVSIIRPLVQGYHIIYLCFTSVPPGRVRSTGTGIGKIITDYAPGTFEVVALHYDPYSQSWFLQGPGSVIPP